MRGVRAALAAFLLWTVAALAAAEPPARLPAAAWLLADQGSGDVLVEHEADRPLPPASLTKLMTAYLVFESLRDGRIALDQSVRISAAAARTRGSRVPLAAGAEARVEDLIKSMLLRSANNAAVALAEHVAGSEAGFVGAMNARARDWGLRGTTFANSSGLDAPGHESTARDLTRIAAALIRDFPDYYDWFGLRDFEFHGIALRNGNRLLYRDQTVDGIKTGYTRGAGWCLIASARQDETRFIATVLGAPNRASRVRAAEELLHYGFRRFETRLVHRADEPVAQARVWMGEPALVPVGLLQDVYLTLPRGAHARLEMRLQLEELRYAPVRRGEPLGTLTLALDDEVLARHPIAALDGARVGGLAARAIDNLYLWLR